MQASGKLDLKEPIYRQLSAWYPANPDDPGQQGYDSPPHERQPHSPEAHFRTDGQTAPDTGQAQQLQQSINGAQQTAEGVPGLPPSEAGGHHAPDWDAGAIVVPVLDGVDSASLGTAPPLQLQQT